MHEDQRKGDMGEQENLGIWIVEGGIEERGMLDKDGMS